MMNRVIALLILVVTFSCPFAGYPSSARGEPVRIIFDTDMGSDCDDAGALAVLRVYADRGLAEIIGCIYSSGKVPYGAGIVEGLGKYLVAEEHGWLEFDVDKAARWIQGERRNPQAFVSLKAGMHKEMADYLNGLLAATPEHQQ